MKRWASIAGSIFTLLLLLLPATFLLTFLLIPVWRWLETTFAIESIGHSGPAVWCYATVFGILACSAIAWLARRWRRPGAASI